jgi:hypothetical protein
VVSPAGGLRAVLAAVRGAPPGAGRDDLARRLGLRRDEFDAMVDYWVHRGELAVDRLGGCPPAGCGGCPVAATGCGPGVLALRVTAAERGQSRS